ncbi:hypothetical protein KIN20_025866 [Parelaphostrongylus tenuis]|uniref:Uncharacterized protein n=1 Tax=Parelaphostrongylus tenuis TaxID=148309 RepID=A0AAD5NC50_PARTN|nr:hypothetical protein KIN20_025866 [Parelaphostrongylus tenuis]
MEVEGVGGAEPAEVDTRSLSRRSRRCAAGDHADIAIVRHQVVKYEEHLTKLLNCA